MCRSLLISSLALVVAGQQVDPNPWQPERAPSLPIQVCSSKRNCTRENTTVALDANYRWTYPPGTIDSCYTGLVGWSKRLCPDGKTCAANCAMGGTDLATANGVTTPADGAINLRFATVSEFSTSYTSRVFLKASENKYRMFNLLNKEFTFDVDVSKLPCGVNGALYFVEMDEDGGMARYPSNKAGAKYGTGYCDSKCPQSVRFINGEGNVEGWVNDDPATRGGRYGSCCPELSVWDANSESNALSAHPCLARGQRRCDGDGCSSNSIVSPVCDAAGCDFNPYRVGKSDFYGPGAAGGAVNTSRPLTVVTQFITADNTDKGALSRINRLYVQDGKVIENTAAAVPGVDPVNHISDKFCRQQKDAFSERDHFTELGGMFQMGKSLEKMVLVMVIQHDYKASMNWLDSVYPLDRPKSDPGVLRGRCDPAEGEAKLVESRTRQYQKNAYVQFSNLKLGSINSTF